jgi:hypothetical protein
MYPFVWNRDQKEARGPTLYHVSRVSSVVLMESETGPLQLLTPLLLTGGKRVDLIIHGNVVLNTFLIHSAVYASSLNFTL